MLRVLHLDHSAETSGAELALMRMASIAAEESLWDPLVAIPRLSASDPGRGVFESLAPTSVVTLSPRQLSGASSAGLWAGAHHGLRILALGVSAARAARRHRAQVIHSNSTRAAIAGLVSSRLTGLPLVVHIRDMVHADTMGSFGVSALRNAVLPRAAAVVAPSTAALDTARAYLGTDSIAVVVPSAIGLSTPASIAPCAPVPQTIGMVARLAPWKGQALLMEAFATLAESYPTVRLRLVGGARFGDTNFEQSLVDMADRLKIRHRVDFVGEVHPSRIASEIDAMDICVQCSTEPEPLGQNVLQYLARGRVVVASGEGGPLDWIEHGENGLLFRPRESASLAEELSTLMDSLTLRERLSQGAVRTSSSINDEASTRKMLDVLSYAAGRTLK